MSKESLAQRALRLRESLDLTQEKLEEVSGVPRRTIQNIEHGKTVSPHQGTIDALAAVFGVSPDELRYGRSLGQPLSSTTIQAESKASLIGSISMRLPMLSEQELRTLLNLIDARLPENSEAKLKV